MIIKENILFCLVVLCMLLPESTRADDARLLKGYTLTVGISAKQLDFDYYRNKNDSNPSGSMTEGMYITYLLRAGSPYILSNSKRWGYYFETGISDFSMSRQNVGNREKKLGTSVDGRFWYISPIGFYLFGPAPENKNELSLITGIGVGIGYLDADGDMILTEDGSNDLHKVDANGVDLAINLLIEAHYGKWMTRIYGGGPFLDKGGSTYSIFDFAWDIGYTYTF